MKYIISLLLCLSIINPASAAIRALGSSGGAKSSHSNKKDYASENIGSTPVISLKGSNTVVICNKKGFTLQKCPSGYAPVLPCPQNNKYFKDCCPQNYRFTTRDCIEKGLKPSTATCLGFHACLAPEIENAK